ncbi:MAG: hypothetical protein HOY78_30815 [Saccharothrix sp.]|nr:hypothetical protein [Saccharothrix sp.]
MADRRGYSADDITVFGFPEAVFRRPGMFFGVGLGHPDLATRVLTRVLGHSLHPAAAVGPPHTARAHAEVRGDFEFAVTDDLADRSDLGYHGTLLGPSRLDAALAAALSTRTTVEVWRDGRGRRQELHGLRPASAVEEFAAPPGTGTRVEVELDPAHFGGPLGGIDALDLHGEWCADTGGPGRVLVRDLRGANPVEHRYT